MFWQGSVTVKGSIQLVTVWFFIAQSLPLLPIHRLNMTWPLPLSGLIQQMKPASVAQLDARPSSN